jgi:hypothetical protein
MEQLGSHWTNLSRKLSTQLRATWHNGSLDMVVLPSTGDSRYRNCFIDGGTSPEYFGCVILFSIGFDAPANFPVNDSYQRDPGAILSFDENSNSDRINGGYKMGRIL